MKAVSILMYGKFALLGAVVGIFSSLFGVGGGIIMVPVLVILAGFGQHMAQGISLAVMVPTALVGGFGYWREGNVNLWIAAAVCVGSIPMAHLGQGIAQKLPQTTRYAKQQLNFWRDLSWHETVNHARDWLAMSMLGDEAQEAVKAFLKRSSS